MQSDDEIIRESNAETLAQMREKWRAALQKRIEQVQLLDTSYHYSSEQSMRGVEQKALAISCERCGKIKLLIGGNGWINLEEARPALRRRFGWKSRKGDNGLIWTCRSCQQAAVIAARLSSSEKEK